MFCLNCYCVLIILLYRERFYFRSAKFSSLYREYRYIEDRYIRVLSHTFYCNFCQDIEYSSLYREYRYIEDCYIGVPLYRQFIIIIIIVNFKEARNSFVGRAQTGFQFTHETQKSKRTNKNGVALSSGFNILRRSFKSCM